VFSKNDKDSFMKTTEIKVGGRLFVLSEKFELTPRNVLLPAS
jgi:hypothetical protein